MSDMDLRPTDRQATIGDRLASSGVSRRRFLDFCLKMMAAAPLGLSLTKHATPEAVASEIEKARRPSVIWLHMQDCTGCSETLLRTSTPDVGDLILDLISLDYHETLMAASGHQAEAALHDAMKENKGNYVVVVEGSIPTEEMGQYLYVAGKKGVDIIKEVCADAAACIAIGSCASWGGIPSAPPNPTGATGLDSLVKDKPVVNIPGCPPNPYNLLAVVLQYATAGTLPALDDKGRPNFAYGRRIHEHCPRRPHFDAGRFVQTFGDEGHREGWCLYQMGCKGPETHAPCSTRSFNEVVDAWPIGIGAPCFGCTEKSLAFKVPYFDRAKIHEATPPNTYPPIEADAGEGVSPWAVGAVGAAAGALAAGAAMVSRKFSDQPGDDSVPGKKKGD